MDVSCQGTLDLFNCTKIHRRFDALNPYFLSLFIKYRYNHCNYHYEFTVKIDIIVSDCSLAYCESLLLKMISYMYVNLVG